ncbi:hypothetical protein [Microbacterium sp. TWP3-1-2b2]|uniref:hypothetical protein n=1 Tax=Microbacterium sp. TWP3-1-2b2 TaxID=2804651 RepID=UPI003CECB342
MSNSEVCFLPTATNETIVLLAAIRDSDSWSASDRPDFYSETHELAIEVMRVDDHPQVGKITNPTLAREREAEHEVRAAFPTLDSSVKMTVIADTGLPSAQDHSFDAHRKAFARIVEGHTKKVTAYRESHPGYGLAMIIHDESSAFVQAEHAASPLAKGEIAAGQPHLWFLDTYFTRIIAASKADFVIWSTPYKHTWHLDASGRRAKLDLPTLAIYDIAAMLGWEAPLAYDPSRMLSLEE